MCEELGAGLTGDHALEPVGEEIRGGHPARHERRAEEGRRRRLTIELDERDEGIKVIEDLNHATAVVATP